MTAHTNRPLVITHGSIESTILTPPSDYLYYQQLTNGFSKSLPEPTEGFADDDEPATKSELLTKFLGYVVNSSVGSSTEKTQAIKLILEEFETRFLHGLDIHTFAASALNDDAHPTTLYKIKNNLIKNYYAGKVALDKNYGLTAATSDKGATSGLLQAAKDKEALVYAIFGGQGNTDDYFEELREVYETYNGLVSDFLHEVQSKVQHLIETTPEMDRIFTNGFDLINWLENPESTPDSTHLLSIPISCPLICVIQLCHYIISCKILGATPGEVRSALQGTTGHSQGLVTALAIASSSSWESFHKESLKAVEFLFFLAVRCLQVYPNTSLPPHTVKDSEENGEGTPGPMLSIRDLTYEQVTKFVKQTNQHLPEAKHIGISLVNGARNVVVTGPPQSLYGLNLNLRNAKAPTGLEQSRIPHSQRKLKFSSRFLPILSPFHSKLLAPAVDLIVADLKKAGIEFNAADLAIPVFDTYNGKDLREQSGSIAARVVDLINLLPVNWETATNFKATHFVDFGPGGASGLGVLTHRNKEGTGVRIVVAGAIGADSEDSEFGYKQELFDRQPSSLKYASNWLKEFQPTLVKTKAGKVYVDTKFSRLLGKAPLMVPGMTPTTVSPEFLLKTLLQAQVSVLT
ncbi:unnamed protein product [Ambrosiozyma monospora]|uniref:Unnamed protein product n=1 Tax=Ambrosiozyma monospora TaxID=43982 RepID=A0A9W6YWM2_AMBMO|nr:unnamed protein product [Ambrosiozyma monospora]